MKIFLKANLPWILMMVAITIQSSMGSIKIPDMEFRMMDKAVHFIVFGILGFLMIRGFYLQPLLAKTNPIIAVIVIGALFSASDEWHQTFVPGRMGDIWDWVADTLGIIFFVLIFWLIRKKKAIPE